MFSFLNSTSTSVSYTLSLHDALPIYCEGVFAKALAASSHVWVSTSTRTSVCVKASSAAIADRKSTRLNSSHVSISYAVFCMKKKKHTQLKQLTKRETSHHSNNNTFNH